MLLLLLSGGGPLFTITLNGGVFNKPPWNVIAWNGPGTSGFIFPMEIVCVEAEVIFTVEMEGEVPVC
jgi:hypothetical protein